MKRRPRSGFSGGSQQAANVLRLGVKELWGLWRDPVMLVLVVFLFTVAIHTSATALPETLHNAAVAVVDGDASPLSTRIVSALHPPQFTDPLMISPAEIDPGLDAGRFTFALHIPPDFQRDVLAGRSPALQLNTDATRMSQAFTGTGYIQQIVQLEVAEFVQRHRAEAAMPVELVVRARFNPTLEQSWSGAILELVNNITMLSILLTGAALIREREHGTIEHLLVMPVTPLEIMLAKVWSMGLVVLVAAGVSLVVIVQGALGVVINGSIPLFLACTALHLFSTASMGIFLATLGRTMPQFALLLLLILLPLQMLSGGQTPRENMPELVQAVMNLAPTTHFVAASQAILYRGAGLAVVWPHLLGIALIGCVLFTIALRRFRRTLAQMA